MMITYDYLKEQCIHTRKDIHAYGYQHFIGFIGPIATPSTPGDANKTKRNKTRQNKSKQTVRTQSHWGLRQSNPFPSYQPKRNPGMVLVVLVLGSP